MGQSCKVSQIIGQTISQSSQWVKRSVIRSVCLSASGLNGQSPSQSASQPVSWIVSQSISRHSFKSLSVRKPASDLFDLFVSYLQIDNEMIFLQVFLSKNKAEDKFYAIKVLNKAAIRKRNEVT